MWASLGRDLATLRRQNRLLDVLPFRDSAETL
jgi:hypothetical protein